MVHYFSTELRKAPKTNRQTCQIGQFLESASRRSKLERHLTTIDMLRVCEPRLLLYQRKSIFLDLCGLHHEKFRTSVGFPNWTWFQKTAMPQTTGEPARSRHCQRGWSCEKPLHHCNTGYSWIYHTRRTKLPWLCRQFIIGLVQKSIISFPPAARIPIKRMGAVIGIQSPRDGPIGRDCISQGVIFGSGPSYFEYPAAGWNGQIWNRLSTLTMAGEEMVSSLQKNRLLHWPFD